MSFSIVPLALCGGIDDVFSTSGLLLRLILPRQRFI